MLSSLPAVAMLGLLVFGAWSAVGCPAQAVVIEGAGGLRQWHRVDLTLTGVPASEAGTPNPFLDHRMVVRFQHRDSQRSYSVPGYFAADGAAADSSAAAGDRWRAHLRPDLVGRWDYSISFRSGAGIAVSDDPNAGTAVQGLDGLNGGFEVVASDKSGRDFRAREHGRLRYVGRHHLQFAGGSWFLKAGADSPENLLAYDEFDGTPDVGGLRKSWAPHVGDWRAGDPTWGSGPTAGRGKGILGALRYLADEGLNAVSFLTYSYNGDDRNVYPYADPKDRTRFDCSKLDQWEVVFEHAGQIGLLLHFKLQEQENDQDMDGGALGVERRLYYRELVARFGHHLAVHWNLGEENTNADGQRRAFAQWFADKDPYGHPVVVHTFPDQKQAVYTPLLGSGSRLHGASLQCHPAGVFQETKAWRQQSAAAGRPWVIANDEQGPANDGVKPDAVDPVHDAVRSQVLWGNLMAGGAGIESYFGYAHAHSDLTCQDYRSRDRWWDQCRHALDFFRDHRVPFQEMENRDALVDRGWCLAGRSGLPVYVIYLGNGGTAVLDLGGAAASTLFDVRWYDPRSGGALQIGSVSTVQGGGKRGVGAPPSGPAAADQVVLVRPAGLLAAVLPYGSGCPGTGGRVPTLHVTGAPGLGDPSFAIHVTRGRPLAPAGFLVGTARASTALGGACTLWVDLVTGVFVPARTDGLGTMRLLLPVPYEPGLLGMRVCFTAGVIDPQGAWLGIAAFSDAVEVRVGY